MMMMMMMIMIIIIIIMPSRLQFFEDLPVILNYIPVDGIEGRNI